MEKRVQNHVPARDIVSQAVVAPPNSPLTFSRLYAGQFLDLMSAAVVVRIVAENGY